MCGIAGIWDGSSSFQPDSLANTVQAMTDSLEHRGPDDQSVWTRGNVALGHRRLSILDLSAAGRQPMTSHCGRFTIVFNGEIYNYQEMRSDLATHGVTFRGASDTEVLVEAISAWGIPTTMQRANGMWALAVYDAQLQKLTLSRDRLGIKPLYYAFLDKRLLFASELKSIRVGCVSSPSLDRIAISQLLRYGYIPAPLSIYQNSFKLMQGTCLELDTHDVEAGAARQPPTPFWSLADVVCHTTKPISDGEAILQFRSLLDDAVAMRMVADVPLGGFLSGGIDSSLIVAAMQRVSGSQVKTFSIGFDEPAYDESPFAEAIAKHLGTEHHSLQVSAAQARDVIPSLPSIYDEPFADSSQIPMLLVSQLARPHVTVSLSGDGGDELMAGYSRYGTFNQRWRHLSRMTRPGRKLAAQTLRTTANLAPRWLGDKLRRRALGLNVHSPSELYAVHNAHWKDAQCVVHGDPAKLRARWSEPPCELSPIETWMAHDASCYLPDDILVKVDRASMSVGLEARVPLLDHRLVELAWRLPMSVKVRNGTTKWLLRELLQEAVPRSLFERPKMGFGVPIGQWLRGPLRDWADDLLAVDRLEQQDLLDAECIASIWHRHRSGQQNWEYMLWDVLMLQSWLDSTKE